MEVCLWDLCPNPHHHSLNLECPCHSMDYLNPPLTDSIAGSHESVLLNQTFSICNELGMEKDQDLSWADPFLVDGNEEEVKPKIEPVTVNSPVAGSSHSGFEEQHSEICVEDQQSELSDENNTKTASEAEEIVDSKSKKRKRSSEKGPKYAFKTRSKEDVLEDGFKWRKYGKKSIKSSPYPRSYYRCSDANCGVKKRVERDPKDQTMLITTYEGKHNHESPSVIYFIGKPIVLQQPGSKPAIVLVNAGLCS